eukprot:1727679-Rhodomonas_salina.3
MKRCPSHDTFHASCCLTCRRATCQHVMPRDLPCHFARARSQCGLPCVDALKRWAKAQQVKQHSEAIEDKLKSNSITPTQHSSHSLEERQTPTTKGHSTSPYTRPCQLLRCCSLFIMTASARPQNKP